jgi:16S rRNA (cytosine967-C5)-methyltransferase
MTPAARLQAAIEILDVVFDAVRHGGASADVLIAQDMRGRRYAGSKDRAAIRESVFALLRACPDAPESARIAALRHHPGATAQFGSGGHAPVAASPEEIIASKKSSSLPDFLVRLLQDIGETPDGPLMQALAMRAPLDLRVNSLKAARSQVLAALPGSIEGALSPLCIRLAVPLPLAEHPLYREGAIDIQDEGSQLVALASSAKAGDRVIDLCAGGGGKALALAAMMDNHGDVIASDINLARLERLLPRAQRLGVRNIRLVAPEALLPGADVVLVDAPCTGSGTWRRNPEARFRLTETSLAAQLASQATLLDRAADLLRPGGRLVYAVCSWIAAEGPEQQAALTSRRPDLTPLPVQRWHPVFAGFSDGCRLSLRPDRQGCDGFFIACWEKL